MTTIISDCSKFCKLTHFDAFLTTLRLEDKVNRFLSKIKKLGIISDQIYKDLYSTVTSPGTLYGLPKIHEAGLPMRPILAAYNTAVYKLNKFLVPMIDGFTRNKFYLKNSYDFYSALQIFNTVAMFFWSVLMSVLYTLMSREMKSLIFCVIKYFLTVLIFMDSVVQNSLNYLD